jgi:hypothetical protein
VEIPRSAGDAMNWLFLLLLGLFLLNMLSALLNWFVGNTFVAAFNTITAVFIFGVLVWRSRLVEQ